MKQSDRVPVQYTKIGIELWFDQEETSLTDINFFSFYIIDNDKLVAKDYLFFNNSQTKDGALSYPREEEKYTIYASLNEVNPLVSKISFFASNYWASEGGQDEEQLAKSDLSNIQNLLIRIYDLSTHEELCRFQPTGDFNGIHSIEMGRLMRDGDDWFFEAIGIIYEDYDGGFPLFESG
jgi:tellurium resistance protein TerD